jgi:prepilin-type N-terminal cleavage/methylation domain-containing protein
MFYLTIIKSFLAKITGLSKARLAYERIRGFTIAELTVVVAIIGLVTTIALANQSSLNNNILLSNLTYEVALSLREAQTYGISVRASSDGGTQSFAGGYGVLFRADQPLEYYLFHDTNDNQEVDVDLGEIVDTYKIENQRGNSITRICIAPCNLNSQVEYITVMFRRPNPEPIFKIGVIGAGGVLIQNTGSIPGPAYIVLNNQAKNNCKTVVVESTGQIRVDSSDPKVCED